MKLTLEQCKEMKDREGNLDLSNTNITALPDNLTVGGWLCLSGTNITALPDNLTVGGWLDLSDTNITNPNNYKKLNEGDYVPKRYIVADGNLTHIKSKRTLPNGYTYYHGKIKGTNVLTDGEFYSHCKSIKDGMRDIAFKKLKDRGQKQFKNLTLDSVLKTDDMINMYRIITGACQQGTENFVNSLGRLKSEYTVREAIEITKGQYHANIFEDFFNQEAEK